MSRPIRRLLWRKAALADLRSIDKWLQTIEGAQPARTILKIKAAAESLVRLGDIGRPSRVEGLRELSVRRAPYVIVYRLTDDAFDILAIYHVRKNR